MKLLGTKVAIRQEVSDLKTKGGLALPDTMQTKLPQGVVVCVGKDVNYINVEHPKHNDINVSEGDRVLFNNFAVQVVNVDGQEYAIIDVSDILVIL